MTGYVMVGDLRVPVAYIALRGGKMVLGCAVAGPVPAFDGESAVTVFGEDGIGVCQGYCNFIWPEALPGETLAVTLTMGMDRCFGDAEAVTA